MLVKLSNEKNIMNNLFICHTPLQAKIALRIIKEKSIRDYDVFYFTNVENEIQKSHFEALSSGANNAIFWPCKIRFPYYFKAIKGIFYSRVYSHVYLASIENIYCHLVLTYVGFRHLVTFDDGNANIIYNSLYYDCEVPLYKRFIYALLGARYTMGRIKLNSEKHYSIYKGKKNIIENVEYIEFIDHEVFLERDVVEGTECNVFLGSYFQYVVSGDVGRFCNALSSYFRKKNSLYYIPHPMEKNNSFDHFRRITQPGLLAEDLILMLSKQYETVNVYGIGSSAQFNLSGVSCVRNYTLFSDMLTVKCNEVSASLIELGALPFYIE